MTNPAALQKVGAAMYENNPPAGGAADAPKPEEELPKDDGTPDTNVPEEPKDDGDKKESK